MIQCKQCDYFVRVSRTKDGGNGHCYLNPPSMACEMGVNNGETYINWYRPPMHEYEGCGQGKRSEI